MFLRVGVAGRRTGARLQAHPQARTLPMPEPPPRAQLLKSAWPEWLRSRFTVPAWSVSLVLHGALLLLVMWTLRRAPAGQDDVPGQEVGIVLKRTSEQGEIYEGEAPEQAQAPSEAADPTKSLDQPPVDLSQVLPAQELQVVGPGPLANLPTLENLRAQRRPARPLAATRSGVPFFGIADPGQRIVYVVDRSASMSDRGRLGVAKVELLASLESLGPQQQFQIVFYNQILSTLKVDQTGRMPFGDEVAKTLASKFIQGVFPDGATDHRAALLEALRLGPDAIFFLTDADEPRLRPAELDEITQRNNGRARIHAVEFGVGPDLGDENFLKQLARRNGGTYRYVDVHRLRK